MEVTVTLERMSEIEARTCVDQIKADLENVRARLFELRERDGWKALGYETWQACITAEFDMSSRHAHRLLTAHAVDRILASPDRGGPIGLLRGVVAEIPEGHARELEPLLADDDAVREVYAEVQQATEGKPTAADYRAAVDRHLGVSAAEFLDLEPPADVAIAAMAEAAPLLREPDEERAYYMVGGQRYWMRCDPDRVADTSSDPSQDAPEWGAFAAWCARVARALEARADSPVRMVR